MRLCFREARLSAWRQPTALCTGSPAGARLRCRRHAGSDRARRLALRPRKRRRQGAAGAGDCRSIPAWSRRVRGGGCGPRLGSVGAGIGATTADLKGGLRHRDGGAVWRRPRRCLCRRQLRRTRHVRIDAAFPRRAFRGRRRVRRAGFSLTPPPDRRGDRHQKAARAAGEHHPRVGGDRLHAELRRGAAAGGRGA